MTSVALSEKTPSAERTVRLSGADLVSLLIRAPWPLPSVCTDPYIGSRPPILSTGAKDWPAYPAADAITHFARAMGAARTGGVAAAQQDIAQLESLRRVLQETQNVYWAEQVEIERLAAEAWTAYAAGKKNEAITLMQTAADREDASEKHVAMENRLWPMRELLGELLLALNRPAQALQAFELSLKTAPNRFRGFHGAAKAAERVRNRAEAKRYYEKLVTLCSQADSDRPELAEAKSFLARRR